MCTLDVNEPSWRRRLCCCCCCCHGCCCSCKRGTDPHSASHLQLLLAGVHIRNSGVGLAAQFEVCTPSFRREMRRRRISDNLPLPSPRCTPGWPPVDVAWNSRPQLDGRDRPRLSLLVLFALRLKTRATSISSSISRRRRRSRLLITPSLLH